MAIAREELTTHFRAAILTLVCDEDDRSWDKRANCLGVDPNLFFPSRGESNDDAKEVCRGCVVQEACLNYALNNAVRFGVWGGMSERERRRLRQSKGQNQSRQTSASSGTKRITSKVNPAKLQLLKHLAQSDICTAPDRKVVRLVAEWLSIEQLPAAQMIVGLKAAGLVDSDGCKGRPVSRLWITDSGRQWLRDRQASNGSGADASSKLKAPSSPTKDDDKEDPSLMAAFETEFHCSTYCDTMAKSTVVHGFTMYTTGQCSCAVCSKAYQDFLDAPKRKAAIRAAVAAGALPVKVKAPKLTPAERKRLITAGRARIAREERWAAAQAKQAERVNRL